MNPCESVYVFCKLKLHSLYMCNVQTETVGATVQTIHSVCNCRSFHKNLYWLEQSTMVLFSIRHGKNTGRVPIAFFREF